MIDTIKFKIRLTDLMIDAIKSMGFETHTTDKFYGFISNEKVSDQILLPPYNTHLTLFSSKYDPYTYYLEGSIPKQVYGENGHLLYPSQLEKFLISTYEVLVKRYKYFTHYDCWFIQRLDMCYAWKYKDQATAEKVLEYLKTLDYPRKNKHIYKTSLSFTARAYSLKFYLKKPEFLQNKNVSDYKSLKEKGHHELAEKTLSATDGVLRFEVEFRKYQLDQIFKKTEDNYKEMNYKAILSNSFYFSNLNQILNVLISTTNRETISVLQSLMKLEEVYDKKTVKILFSFLNLVTSKNSVSKLFLKKYFNATTIKRNRTKLTEAGIGFIVQENLLDVLDLKIPSSLVINKDKPLPA